MQRIIASGQRMTRMIEQLLDFTRARMGGGVELDPREQTWRRPVVKRSSSSSRGTLDGT